MEPRNGVEYILKNYHEIKRELQVKRTLLNITLSESEGEIIEGMNFESFLGEKVSSSKVKNKTLDIALKYREVKEREVREMERDIRKRKLELLNVEVALGVLEEREQRVIRGIYLERKSRLQLCRELYISEVTLNRYRRKGIASMNKCMGMK